MKYPMLNNWFVFMPLNGTRVNVKDRICDEEFTIARGLAHFAQRLDGKTDPYSIEPRLSREEVDIVLRILEDGDMIRRDMVLMKEFGTIYYTLWIPKRTNALFTLAKIYNSLLTLLWLPLLCLGVWMYSQISFPGGENYLMLGGLLGALIGVIFHECGHLFSGISLGADVFELGVMIRNFIPGAYVLMSTEEVKSKRRRVKINAAGIQSNALFAGVCLMLAGLFPALAFPLLCAAVGNIIMALTNLIFLEGLDGESIISELLGIENLDEAVKSVVFNKKKRSELLSKGATGYAAITVGFLIRFFQTALPLFIGINVLEVITLLT